MQGACRSKARAQPVVRKSSCARLGGMPRREWPDTDSERPCSDPSTQREMSLNRNAPRVLGGAIPEALGITIVNGTNALMASG